MPAAEADSSMIRRLSAVVSRTTPEQSPVPLPFDVNVLDKKNQRVIQKLFSKPSFRKWCICRIMIFAKQLQHIVAR